MPRQSKTLLDLVEDGSFLGRRHHQLLGGDRLRWKSLARLQDRYEAATTAIERRRIALEFEKAVPKMHARRERAANTRQEELDKLGPAGSAQRAMRFFPTFLRWEDGSPFRLDPYQRMIIEHGWRRDPVRRGEEIGRRIFQEIGTGIPRGCGKTPFWSGIGLYTTLDGPGRPKVFQTSGAKDQAKLGIEYVGNWIDEDDRLRRWLTYNASKVRRRDGRGEYSVMAASGSLGHGRKPNIGLVDEYWTIEHPNQEKTVTALETAIFKLPDAFWAWISTAGYSKDTELGEAFDSALRLPHVEHHNEGFHIRAWDEESGRLFFWWGLPEGYPLDDVLENDKEMLRLIRLCNPATFVDPQRLLRALKRALSKGDDKVAEWIRFNLNGWTRVKDGWLPTGAWWDMRSKASFRTDAEIWEDDPEIPAGSTIYVAVDAAKKRDTSACVWAARLPNGRIAVRARVWSARDTVPHHVFVQGGRIRNSLVESFIINTLAQHYRIAEVVYDQRYFDTQGENLADAGLTVAEFPQASGLMADAYQHFYEAAIERTMTHTGDPVFAAQVAAAAAVLTEHGWKVFKLQSSEPIDCVPATAMARERCARATDWRNKSVYNRRDLRELEVPAEEAEDEFDDELDEASLIRARLRQQREALAAQLLEELLEDGAEIPWDELEEPDADLVATRLAEASARFTDAGEDELAQRCMAELGRRPPTDDDE